MSSMYSLVSTLRNVICFQILFKKFSQISHVYVVLTGYYVVSLKTHYNYIVILLLQILKLNLEVIFKSSCLTYLTFLNKTHQMPISLISFENQRKIGTKKSFITESFYLFIIKDFKVLFVYTHNNTNLNRLGVYTIIIANLFSDVNQSGTIERKDFELAIEVGTVLIQTNIFQTLSNRKKGSVNYTDFINSI